MSRRPRLLLAAGVAVALAMTTLAVGAGPVGAQVDDPCGASPAADFVCRTYASFTHRPATAAEVERWAPQMPAARTLFVATVARGREGRDQTVTAYYARFGGGVPTAGDLDYWGDQALRPGALRRLETALVANTRTSPARLVETAYLLHLGYRPSATDSGYWQDRIARSTRTRVVAEISGASEARSTRVRVAYRNELDVIADRDSIGYWSERARTGTSYLDLRIALRATPAGYAASNADCAPSAPQTGPTCPAAGSRP